MLSPSELYPLEFGYFFYTSDKRFFNIYFTPYTIEFEENGEIRSEEYLMVGLEKTIKIPESYANQELTLNRSKPSEEIDIALTTAIECYFEHNPNHILIYLLSTERGKQAARKKRFASIIEKLGDEITCFNYEFECAYPDTGFLVLTNNPDIESIELMFDEYVRQFI